MFNKIVVVEPTYITASNKQGIEKYCKELTIYDTNVINEDEMIERIGDADCILASYSTTISRKIIKACKNLKHVALCCSYYGKQFAKVDIECLEEMQITYSYLAEHGDNGVVEYTVAQTVNLLQGLYGKRLKEDSYDLTGIKFGIIGLGNLGKKVAKAFKNLDTDVYYYSRTRKEEAEKELCIKYLELDELLKTVDVISINLNRDVCLIGGDKLKIFGNGKAIINTSIGKCYEANSLKEWLKNKENFYICDAPTVNDDIKDILNYDNVIYTDFCSGESKQCFERAKEQIINNVKNAAEENL